MSSALAFVTVLSLSIPQGSVESEPSPGSQTGDTLPDEKLFDVENPLTYLWNDSESEEMKTAVLQFTKGRDVGITLVVMPEVGDAEFFAELDNLVESHSVTIYQELVTSDAANLCPSPDTASFFVETMGLNFSYFWASARKLQKGTKPYSEYLRENEALTKANRSLLFSHFGESEEAAIAREISISPYTEEVVIPGSATNAKYTVTLLDPVPVEELGTSVPQYLVEAKRAFVTEAALALRLNSRHHMRMAFVTLWSDQKLISYPGIESVQQQIVHELLTTAGSTLSKDKRTAVLLVNYATLPHLVKALVAEGLSQKSVRYLRVFAYGEQAVQEGRYFGHLSDENDG